MESLDMLGASVRRSKSAHAVATLVGTLTDSTTNVLSSANRRNSNWSVATDRSSSGSSSSLDRAGTTRRCFWRSACNPYSCSTRMGRVESHVVWATFALYSKATPSSCCSFRHVNNTFIRKLDRFSIERTENRAWRRVSDILGEKSCQSSFIDRSRTRDFGSPRGSRALSSGLDNSTFTPAAKIRPLKIVVVRIRRA
jgi:hypothetical protein